MSGVRYIEESGGIPAGGYLYLPASSVSAYNATVTITDNSRITGGPTQGGTPFPGPGVVLGANGVFATGIHARVRVEGGTQITDNGGFGAVATNGGAKNSADQGNLILVKDLGTAIHDNVYGGVLSVDDNTWLNVTDFASVSFNGGPGAQGVYGGHVAIRTPAGLSNTSVSFNRDGGLAATTSYLDTRACANDYWKARASVFEGNTRKQLPYDARARQSATINARSSYWGRGERCRIWFSTVTNRASSMPGAWWVTETLRWRTARSPLRYAVLHRLLIAPHATPETALASGHSTLVRVWSCSSLRRA